MQSFQSLASESNFKAAFGRLPKEKPLTEGLGCVFLQPDGVCWNSSPERQLPVFCALKKSAKRWHFSKEICAILVPSETNRKLTAFSSLQTQAATARRALEDWDFCEPLCKQKSQLQDCRGYLEKAGQQRNPRWLRNHRDVLKEREGALFFNQTKFDS